MHPCHLGWSTLLWSIIKPTMPAYVHVHVNMQDMMLNRPKWVQTEMCITKQHKIIDIIFTVVHQHVRHYGSCTVGKKGLSVPTRASQWISLCSIPYQGGRHLCWPPAPKPQQGLVQPHHAFPVLMQALHRCMHMIIFIHKSHMHRHQYTVYCVWVHLCSKHQHWIMFSANNSL
jgi:hypothetical protein